MDNHVNPKLLHALTEYSLEASHAWYRMSSIRQCFLAWRVEQGIVAPLDGPWKWKEKKSRYEGTNAKRYNQTLFHNMIKLGTHNKPANDQASSQ